MVTFSSSKSQNEMLDQIKFEINKKNYSLILVVGALESNFSLIEFLDKLPPVASINLNFSLSGIITSTPKNDLLDPVDLIEKIIPENNSGVLLFKGNNILFDYNLKWNPFDIFKKLSRKYFVIAFWDGELNGKNLKYAHSGHNEYDEFQLPDSDEILIMET